MSNIDISVEEELDILDDIFLYLDWSTRHLKQLQKQNPPTESHHSEALYMFGIMKVCCELLGINPLKWCKATKIPYRRREKSYWHLFNSEKPYEIYGKPLQKQGFYYDLINQMMGTEEKINLKHDFKKS
ncbi:hypothetical protein ABE402_13705 [Bacillus smithii]|uniref:hypothetical protein n=1 Tax=Bacillus smithii TaxID=1479 RepID=UPI003D1B8A8F